MHNSFQSLKTLLFGKKKSFPGVQGVNNTLHREFPMVLSKSDLEVSRILTEKDWGEKRICTELFGKGSM